MAKFDENRAEAYEGGFGDVNIQSLNPEKDPSADNVCWLNFHPEPPEIEKLTFDFYRPGNIIPFYDSKSRTKGRFEVLEAKSENRRIKVKILD